MRKPRLTPINRWLEPLLALVILVGLIRAMVHIYTHGYLPQPFFYEPADVWMDWFNTADWARDNGMYDSWGTIYPPLTFVLLKLVGLPYCYMGGGGAGTAYYARACDWVGIGLLHGIFVMNAVLIAITFYKIDKRTALPRAFALSAGLPMASGLERGNLILLAFTGLLLAFGPLLRSARWRWFAVACAVNFKPYLIATIFPQLLRRRWRWFEGAAVAVVIVYIVTYCLLGHGTPREIVTNITSYTDGQSNALLDLWYAYTYSSTISLLQGDGLPVASLIGSRNVELLLVLLPGLTRLVQLSIVLAAVSAWLRPESVPMFRLTNLGMCLALVTSEAGGYSAALPILFVFMERWRGFGRKWAIIACYLICIPMDIKLDQLPPIIRDTYYTNETQIVTYYIMLGPFVRPLLNMSIPFALACVTIRQVWIDIRAQGWRSRWRFRHDLPIMVGEGAAIPPDGRPGVST